MTPKTDTPTLVPDREVEKEKSRKPSGPRIRCPLCGWSPERKTDGFAPAGMNGTHSILEASAPPAYTSGLRLSAYLVAAGRRIRIGTRSSRL